MAFSPISGAWGTHYADPAAADAWARDAIRKLAAYGEAKEWPEQRARLVDAWTSAAYAYRAANIPPPSDPSFRGIMFDWYGECRTPVEYARSYRVGPLVSQGGGRVASIVAEIWRVVKGAPDQCAAYTAVRLSLSSEANVVSTCLDPTGDGDCDYRGLFTGAASQNADGIYQEHPTTSPRYDASTFEWHDPPGAAGCRITRCSPPLAVSADVLHALLDAWAARGGVLGVIDSTRAFVAATNLLNAGTLNLDADAYIQSSRTAVLDAAQQSIGTTPARATIAAVAGAVAAACANVPVYGWICSLAAAAVGAAAQIIPVAVGSPTDALGVPKASTDATAPWLPSMIRTPINDGRGGTRIPLEVPPPPDSSTAAYTSTGTGTDTGRAASDGIATAGVRLPAIGSAVAGRMQNAPPRLELIGPDGRPIGNTTSTANASHNATMYAAAAALVGLAFMWDSKRGKII